MKAQDLQFTQLLEGSKQFIIPIFQRTYSWERSHCEQLWNDIIRVGGNPDLNSHFIGSAVYIPEQDTSAAISRWLVIDGQQRIGEAKIVDNRYRWGSCTVKDNVNFNWRLIKAPMFVIDYVIVHELAHLMESNHTPRFWNIVQTSLNDLECDEGESKFRSSNFSDFREPGGFVSFPGHR